MPLSPDEEKSREGEMCVCACTSDHPPALAASCNRQAVGWRGLSASGVGTVFLPLCQSCNSRWHAAGRGQFAGTIETGE